MTKVNPKVSAGAVGGALSVLIVAVAQAVGLDIDATVAAALATLLGFAAGWLKTS